MRFPCAGAAGRGGGGAAANSPPGGRAATAWVGWGRAREAQACAWGGGAATGFVFRGQRKWLGWWLQGGARWGWG
jgi:hypothetical protein